MRAVKNGNLQLPDGNEQRASDSEKQSAKRRDLADRLLQFAIRIVRLANALPRTPVGKHVTIQLLKSGTSPGANYGEARGAESRADFVHKMGVVLKELKESRFWLHLIHGAELLKPSLVKPLLQECEELCAIVGQSVITAKKRS
jgi:four helix bundle protein